VDNTIDLFPLRGVFVTGEPVRVELRGASRGELKVLCLGDVVGSVNVARVGVVDVGVLPPGGYGIEFWTDERVARTAVQVADDAGRYCRYGFVVDFAPDRDMAGVADNIRRLHLTDIQFYDWAYRHAALLGGGENYADALGRPVSLKTVRRLVETVREFGARALGYAAVYAVGNDEWPNWKEFALLRAKGSAYGLGDFLSLVDPADDTWLTHFTADLRAATTAVGFDGYHLDQYGYPKRALRASGEVVDVEDSFATVIERARIVLPEARLVFNNVNNFPTWRTVETPVDVVYVEVWQPNTTLAHLARLAHEAVSSGYGKPVVIAAYQRVYDTAPTRAADLATAFTMATLFSHGATHLLCGEADRLLVDPYYVRNHVIETSTASMLKRWYDFLVEHVALLQHPRAVDVTAATAGDYNGDCDVAYDGADVTDLPVPAKVWRRVVRAGEHLVIHLVNLVGQDDLEWDAARKAPVVVADGVVRVRRVGAKAPRIRVADPDYQPHLVELQTRSDDEYVTAVLPPLNVWQMLVVDL
jgi:dextranase